MSPTKSGNRWNGWKTAGVVLVVITVFIGIAFASLSSRLESCETKVDANIIKDAEEHRDFQAACERLDRVDRMVSWLVIKNGGNPQDFNSPLTTPRIHADDSQDR